MTKYDHIFMIERGNYKIIFHTDVFFIKIFVLMKRIILLILYLGICFMLKNPFYWSFYVFILCAHRADII